MQTIKQKGTAPPARTRWHSNQFGISPRAYVALAKFSNAAEKLGVKTTAITQGMFGSGCRIQLCGKADYEVLVDGAGMTLGRVEADGRRIKLAQGSSGTEPEWAALLRALQNNEGRAALP